MEPCKACQDLGSTCWVCAMFIYQASAYGITLRKSEEKDNARVL